MEKRKTMERLIALTLLLWAGMQAHAQQVDEAIRQGNAAYQKGDNPKAVEEYLKAEGDERALFNMGNAWYREDSLADAQRAFENAIAEASTPERQARAYHNLGNTRMKQGQYQEAITAYKEALKRTPTDEDTRYNLAYAQKMLAQQEQQQQDQGDQDQDQDQGKDDQQGNQEEQQDQDETGDQQDRDQDERGKEQQQQPPSQQPHINPRDAERMLDAAQQQEQEVQDQVRRMMQPNPTTPPEKDW